MYNMIVDDKGRFETNSMYPAINWYTDEHNYVIDETTEEGQLMAQTYIDNYPLVTFTHDGEFVTSVSVIELERPPEVVGKTIELTKNEQGQWEYIYVDIPKTDKEIQQETMNMLGQELTMMKLSNIQKDSTIDALGQELVSIKLQMMMGGGE